MAIKTPPKPDACSTSTQCSAAGNELKTWIQGFVYFIIIGLVPIFVSLSLITNASDVDMYTDGKDKDVSRFNLKSCNLPDKLEENAFTYKLNTYFNPEHWSLWDYCLSQHKWYICTIKDKNIDEDNFRRSCQQLFPCVNSPGDGRTTISEVITKLYRWPYIFQIVYGIFRQAFYSPMKVGPSHWLFSKVPFHASNVGGLEGIGRNIMFLLQILLYPILLIVWVIYFLICAIIMPFAKLSHLLVDFTSGSNLVGGPTLIILYIFLFLLGYAFAFITFFVILIIFAWHLFIRFFIRLYNNTPLLNKIKTDVKQLLVIYFYYVSIAAILTAYRFGPSRTFLYFVILAVVLLFFTYKDDLIPKI